MINQQLINFIISQQATGKNKEDIVQALRATGWTDVDIETGFQVVASGVSIPGTMATTEELPGPMQILSEAWEIYNQRFWTLVGIYVLPLAIWVVAGLLVGLGSVHPELASKYFQGGGIIVAIVLVVALIIAAIYIGVWGQVALIVGIKDHGEKIDIKESFKRSRAYISPYFNASLAAGLITALGFILLIIPGIIFLVWYAFAGLITITENLSYGKALKQSKALVKGRWWAVFGRIFFGGLIGIIISLVANSAGNILGKDGGTWTSTVVSLFVSPLLVAYNVQLYLNLKKTQKVS
jgi:hypothetical protein